MNSYLSVGIAMLIGIAAVFFLSGCAGLGKGAATLITAAPGKGTDGFQAYFPDLVSDRVSMRPMSSGATTDRDRYDAYLVGKLGCKDCETASLSILIRDRTKIPPFLPIDISIEKQLLSLYLDKDLSAARKEALANAARANTFNVPDLPDRTALHEISSDGRRRYFYYPRIQIDFASKLMTPSELDRFEYLGLAIKLRTVAETAADATLSPEKPVAVSNCAKERVRIIDFSPKASDIVEYARGELTQKAQLDAKASASNQEVAKATGSAVAGLAGAGSTQTTTGSEKSATSNLAPDVALSLSETFVNALKDSIEARSAGILDEGETFFVDFKAIKSRRIGGTYTFDTMLEVPAYLEYATDKDGNVDQDIYFSTPCAKEVRADAYLVAVVRHVYDRGFTGYLTKVPEPENDQVYLQVVTKHLTDVLLWKYASLPWTKNTARPPAEVTLSVVTNRADGQYVVRQPGDVPTILAEGSGKSSKVRLGSKAPPRVRVEFLDISEVVKDTVRIFSAPAVEIDLAKAGEGQPTVVGNYLPQAAR